MGRAIVFGNMENLKIMSSFHKESKKFNRVQYRATHGFIFKIKGYAEFAFSDRIITVNEGEVIFLPQGSAYEATTYYRDGNLYTSINFCAELENPEVGVYPFENFPAANYIYRNFSELWNFGTLSDKYKCLSLFYDLISYISRIEHSSSADERKFGLIEPAVEYLKKNMYDSSFRVDKLHKLCGISDTYFRKIFGAEFDMTPQEYVVTGRMSYAKSIIESGDFDSIKEVSELVGYNDPLYFSKAFRKIYGISPSGVNKN